MKAIISALYHSDALLFAQRTFKFITHRIRLLSSVMQEAKLASQKFDHFLVVDFEATCDGKKNTLVPQEIIEFPVLKVNGRSFEIESIFHEYVQPTVHKTLTPYCSELTGINQDMVDGQPHLDEVLHKFQAWMEEENLFNAEFAFVTYTEWDLNKMLPSQCEHLGINVPLYMRRWIDVQQSFADETGHWPTRGLKDVMRYLKIPHVGRQHSGIDDCKNTVNVMKTLARNGHIFNINAPKQKPSVMGKVLIVR